MKSLQLSQIWIYPIKSLGGVPLRSARVHPKGLEYDRRWMLIDENGVFMTQRVYPQMALFQLAIDHAQLTVGHKNEKNERLTIPLNNGPGGQPVDTLVWEDRVTVIEPSKAFSDWFSEMLGMRCRLVHFPEDNPRPVDPGYAVRNDHVSLADGFPFLIIGQSSLDDLNQRLDEPVPVNRFRPNLVFTGGDPYEEDTLKNFAIGRNRFVGVKPCSRCVMTTVNQQTGEKGQEPLKTLATYRTRNNKICFGQNVIALDHQVIAVGDELTRKATQELRN